MQFVTPAAGDGKLLPFHKPKDWDESANGPCGTLTVRRQVEGAGPTAFLGLYSNWKPSADELVRLNAGHVVELMCCGVQPAVSVGVVPCADPNAPALDKTIAMPTLRAIFAEELERVGDKTRLADMVRTNADNSLGGQAALAAMRRVAAPILPGFADVRGAVARGWCADGNTEKEMDSVLAEAIAREIATLFGVPLPCA